MYNVENKCNDCGEHWESESKNGTKDKNKNMRKIQN